MSKSAPCSPVKPAAPPVQKVATRADSFHVLHKVPTGDTPYVRAKHVQLVDKDPDRAIALFWAAINAGDRVDSALKDMAIVMKQQNRPEEAIEAIKSLRMRCSDQAQESLDNVLLDLYKRCGRLDDQIALLKHKLHLINQGMAFNGKRTKTARSLGKKFQVSIEQEATRLLGNLGWAYMQQSNFVAAEAVYRKALTIEPDNNKVCNLGICLMKQGRLDEAKAMLQSVNPSCNDNRWSSDSHLKSYERAQEMLLELETSMGDSQVTGTLSGELSSFAVSGTDLHGYELQYSSLWEPQPALPRQPRQVARSNLDKQFSQVSDSCRVGALLSNPRFGPSQSNHGSNSQGLEPGMAETLYDGPMQMSQQRNEPQIWQLQSCGSGSGEDNDIDYSSPDEALNTHEELQLDKEAHASVPIHYPFHLPSSGEHAPEFYDDDLLDRNPPPALSEQTLRSTAEPFNPLAVSTRVSSDNSVVKKITSSARVLIDSLPLTFDRTNELRNSQVGGPEDSRGTKQSSHGGIKLTKNSPALSNEWGTSKDYDENRPTSQPPLSKKSLDISYHGAIHPQQNFAALPPLHNAAGKRSRTLTPVKDKTVSPWGSLGFTDSPRSTDFGLNDSTVAANDKVETEVKGYNADKEVIAEDSASAMELQRRRRLRVFQEMTLSSSLEA